MSKVSKLVPVDFLDIQGLEAWMEDLATQGLFFTGMGPYCAHFERREPSSARYHAEPRSDFQKAPTGEQVTWAAQMGWVWAGRLGHFDFYRADDPDTEDFHTDPVAQSYSLEKLSKKMTLFSLVLALMMAAQMGFMVFARLDSSFGPIYHLINFGSLYTNFMVFLLLLMTIHFGWQAYRLRRLQKQLQSGFPAPHPARWNRSGLFRQVYTVLLSLVGVAVLCTSLYTMTAGRWRAEIALAHRPFPILSLPQLEDDPTYTPVPFYYPGYTGPDRDNYVTYDLDMLAHRYQVEQAGTVTGRELPCSLRMDWYDLTFAALAPPLMDDLLNYHVYDYDYKYQPEEYEIQHIQAPGFDELTVVTHVEYGTQQLFARRGDRVAYLRYNGTQDLVGHLEEISQLLDWNN